MTISFNYLSNPSLVDNLASNDLILQLARKYRNGGVIDHNVVITLEVMEQMPKHSENEKIEYMHELKRHLHLLEDKHNDYLNRPKINNQAKEQTPVTSSSSFGKTKPIQLVF